MLSSTLTLYRIIEFCLGEFDCTWLFKMTNMITSRIKKKKHNCHLPVICHDKPRNSVYNSFMRISWVQRQRSLHSVKIMSLSSSNLKNKMQLVRTTFWQVPINKTERVQCAFSAVLSWIKLEWQKCGSWKPCQTKPWHCDCTQHCDSTWHCDWTWPCNCTCCDRLPS